jgi:hypothetical protein
MFIVPQPYMGVPATGALTLTFLGEAGVVGRADIAERGYWRCGSLEAWKGDVGREQFEAVQAFNSRLVRSSGL